MLFTKCKYLPFDAVKTAHLDRLCLEIFLRESRTNFGCLFSVCCKLFLFRLRKHKRLLLLLQKIVQRRQK